MSGFAFRVLGLYQPHYVLPLITYIITKLITRRKIVRYLGVVIKNEFARK